MRISFQCSLATLKENLLLPSLAGFLRSEWWRTQSVLNPSVNGGLSNPSPPPTLHFCGGRFSGCNSNSPCPTTLPGYFLSYDLPLNKKASLGEVRKRKGRAFWGQLPKLFLSYRQRAGKDTALPPYLWVSELTLMFLNLAPFSLPQTFSLLLLAFVTLENASVFLYFLRDSSEKSQEAVSGPPGRDLFKWGNFQMFQGKKHKQK